MHHRRIYVASSWRNTFQPGVVAALRHAGHEVYDFRNPAPGNTGFAWQQCVPGVGAETIAGYLQVIESPRAKEGFSYDKAALDWCDTCILVLPCGRSAHLEAGYTAGQGKDTYFLLHPDKFEPELMYLLGTGSTPNLAEIMGRLNEREPGSVLRWHQESGGHFARPEKHALRLFREVVELCIAIGIYPYEMNKAYTAEKDKAELRREWGGDPRKVPEEWADCAILLELFRQYYMIDGHAEVRKKLDILYTRDWEADDGGALYRPKEPL